MLDYMGQANLLPVPPHKLQVTKKIAIQSAGLVGQSSTTLPAKQRKFMEEMDKAQVVAMVPAEDWISMPEKLGILTEVAVEPGTSSNTTGLVHVAVCGQQQAGKSNHTHS
jgi:hypothetical protein